MYCVQHTITPHDDGFIEFAVFIAVVAMVEPYSSKTVVQPESVMVAANQAARISRNW